MAKINIDDIKEFLKPYKWQLKSSEYTNLQTQMEFICDEGHIVYSTWDKIRKKPECPVCKQNIWKENKPVIVEKPKEGKRVLALDQSTHKTGWSIFDGEKLIKYGVFETSTKDEVTRIHEVKNWLTSMCDNWKPDAIGIEGIQYQTYAGITTFQTLARLQGVLLDFCYENKIICQICPTATWRGFCKVTGKQRTDVKRSMQLLAKKWFDISVTDDESDAIGIGKYMAHFIKE